MGPRRLTIHAAGGPAMIRAAVEGAQAARQRPMILAVTALTSLDASDLAAIGVTEDVSTYVKRLARLAQDNGADGVVCAASEIAMLREPCGPDFKQVGPGLRPKGDRQSVR